MIASRPELSQSVPRGSMLLINTVLEKIVRAGLVSSMMETNGPLRRSFFRLMGTRHDEKGQILPERQAVARGPQFQAILLDSAMAHQSRGKPGAFVGKVAGLPGRHAQRSF